MVDNLRVQEVEGAKSYIPCSVMDTVAAHLESMLGGRIIRFVNNCSIRYNVTNFNPNWCKDYGFLRTEPALSERRSSLYYINVFFVIKKDDTYSFYRYTSQAIIDGKQQFFHDEEFKIIFEKMDQFLLTKDVANEITQYISFLQGNKIVTCLFTTDSPSQKIREFDLQGDILLIRNTFIGESSNCLYVYCLYNNSIVRYTLTSIKDGVNYVNNIFLSTELLYTDEKQIQDVELADTTQKSNYTSVAGVVTFSDGTKKPIIEAKKNGKAFTTSIYYQAIKSTIIRNLDYEEGTTINFDCLTLGGKPANFSVNKDLRGLKLIKFDTTAK